MTTHTDPIDAFKLHLERVKVRSPRTADTYARILHAFKDFAGNVEAVVRADTHAVRRFLSEGEGEDLHVRRARLNLRLAALRSFYAYLTEIGVRPDNPAKQFQRLRVPYREVETLSLAEMVRLTDAAGQHSPPAYRRRNAALVLTLLHTGLRVSEVAGLDLSQFDAASYVFRAVHRKGGKVFSAALNDVVVEAITEYLTDRPRLSRGDDCLALFLSDRGRRLAVRSIQEMVARYAKVAGIQRAISPHTLRHASATTLAALGTNIRTIQEICGHASVKTTQRYVHVAGRDRMEAARALGEAFQSQRAELHGQAPPP